MIPKFLGTRALGTVLAVGLALGVTGGAMAQAVGTPAGTTVTNALTSLSYNSGVDVVTVDPTTLPSAEFVVDRKIDLTLNSTLAPTAEATPLAGTTQARLVFELTNIGNAPQGFALAVDRVAGDLGLTLAATATATPAAGEYSILHNTTADLDGATPYAAGSIGDLGSGEVRYVLIVAHVPADAVDNRFDDFRVRAVATTPGTDDPVVELRQDDLMAQNIIFADAAPVSTLTGDPIDAGIDTARDGGDTDEGRIRVNSPIIAATKSVAVVGELASFACHDINLAPTAPNPNEGAIPGACVEYTISVDNTSASATDATAITITDQLPAQLTFRSVSDISYRVIADDSAGSGTTTTQPANAGGTVSAVIGRLPAGERATFRIRASIN